VIVCSWEKELPQRSVTVQVLIVTSSPGHKPGPIEPAIILSEGVRVGFESQLSETVGVPVSTSGSTESAQEIPTSSEKKIKTGSILS